MARKARPTHFARSTHVARPRFYRPRPGNGNPGVLRNETVSGSLRGAQNHVINGIIAR